MIRALAQKQYNHRLRAAAEEDLKTLQKCVELLSGLSATEDEVFESMPDALKAFIDRDALTDRVYAAKWEKSQKGLYPNSFKKDDNLRTMNGEFVRSKSEVIIADRLKAAGVPYKYEKLLDKTFTITEWDMYPDFTCLNVRTGKTYYWEHMGLMDDPKYCVDSINKINNYAADEIFLGSELIVTFEAKGAPLRTSGIDAIIEKYLK